MFPLNRPCEIKLGSLVVPPGRRRPSEGETLELLLVAQFPNSVVIYSILFYVLLQRYVNFTYLAEKKN
jgi:hypothetical protein